MSFYSDSSGAAGVGTAGPPPLRRPPATRGWAGRRLLVVVLWLGLLASLALWWLDTPSASLNNRGELFIAASRITGLIAGYVLLVEVALRSRIGLLERWVGAELILKWHREFG